MTQREKKDIEKIFEILSDMDKRMERLDRFIYGDPDNEVDGLVKRQKKDEERLESLEGDIRPVRVVSRFVGNHPGKVIGGVITAILTLVGVSSDKIQKILNSIINY